MRLQVLIKTRSLRPSPMPLVLPVSLSRTANKTNRQTERWYVPSAPHKKHRLCYEWGLLQINTTATGLYMSLFAMFLRSSCGYGLVFVCLYWTLFRVRLSLVCLWFIASSRVSRQSDVVVLSFSHCGCRAASVLR